MPPTRTAFSALGWGPDQEPVDFFYDSIGLEVKVTRHANVHHVSQTQVERPRGEFKTYLLSIWVGMDSNQGISLAEKVDLLLNRVSDPTAFLRRLAQVGYSPHDRGEYDTKFLVLEAPRWFRAEDVPRVREIDEGVSNVRYVVTLDVDDCLDAEQSLSLGRHFWGFEGATGQLTSYETSSPSCRAVGRGPPTSRDRTCAYR